METATRILKKIGNDSKLGKYLYDWESTEHLPARVSRGM